MTESKELKQFGKEFLLAFTTEMVRKHGGADFYRLKKILEKESSIKEKIDEYRKKKKSKKAKEELGDYEKKQKGEEIKSLLQEKKAESSPEAIKQRLSEPRKKPSGGKQVLRVPQTKLPPQFRNVRPQAKEREIELGKLDNIANDPNVKEIECKGPGEKIHVRGSMGYQPTQITLNEDEISEILNKFSDKSQIPIMEGEYHVAVGDLTITASVQEERGKSSFVIKKISRGPQGPQGRPPRGRSPGPSSPPRSSGYRRSPT